MSTAEFRCLLHFECKKQQNEKNLVMDGPRFRPPEARSLAGETVQVGTFLVATIANATHPSATNARLKVKDVPIVCLLPKAHLALLSDSKSVRKDAGDLWATGNDRG